MLDTPAGPPPLAVHALDPGSGRTLDCATTEPGVQIYTADWFNGSYRGIGGRYGQYAAFPTTVLRPGQVFSSTTSFRLGVQK